MCKSTASSQCLKSSDLTEHSAIHRGEKSCTRSLVLSTPASCSSTNVVYIETVNEHLTYPLLLL